MKTQGIRLAATRTGLLTSLVFSILALVASANMVNFLNQFPYRQVLIESDTNNAGSALFTEGFSRQRAEPVFAVPDQPRYRQPQIDGARIWL